MERLFKAQVQAREKALALCTCLAALGGAFWLLLAFSRCGVAPLWGDEGYNLEVVANLAEHGAYASYGSSRPEAWWSARQLVANPGAESPPIWYFDPRVTTGPAVLVPLAAVWQLTGGDVFAIRAALGIFFLLFLAALWRLTPRTPWRLLTFLSVSALVVSFPGKVHVSHLYAPPDPEGRGATVIWYNHLPGTVLGEYPALAFFLWGAFFLLRQRWVVGGLLLGLAVQAKLMFAPAVLCTVVAALLVMPQLRRPVTLGAVFLATLTPTLLFEAFRLATLGSGPAWLASWQEFRHFSRGELAAFWAETLEEKWLEWRLHGPGVLALPLLGAALMLRFSARASAASQPNGTAEEVRTTGWLLAAGGTALLVTWVWQSAQPSYRQAFGGILLLFAAVMLGSRWWQALWPRPSQAQTRGVFVMLGLFLLCASLLAWYALWLWRVANLAKWQQHQVRRLERLTANLRKGPLRFVPEYGTLQDQVRAAGALKQSGAKAISPLVQHFQPYPVLAGLRMGLCSQPQQALVATFAAEAILRRSRDEFRGMCQQIFFESPDVLLCWPKAELVNTRIRISRWGPLWTLQGVIPNRQPSGEGVFWFILEQPVGHKPLLLLLADGKPLGNVLWSGAGDGFLVVFPGSFVANPRLVTLELLDSCSQTRTPVGVFQILPQ